MFRYTNIAIKLPVSSYLQTHAETVRNCCRVLLMQTSLFKFFRITLTSLRTNKFPPTPPPPNHALRHYPLSLLSSVFIFSYCACISQHYHHQHYYYYCYYYKLKLNSVALVRTRTIPTERPPPVSEVSANFFG